MATPEEIARMSVDDFNNRTYRQNAPSYIAEDCVSFDEPTGMESYGVEGANQSNDVWVTAFPDASAEIISIESDGNVVTAKVIGRGTFTGEMMTPDGSTIPGNGSTMELAYTQIAEFEDGMIVRLTAQYDMNDMMMQLGLA